MTIVASSVASPVSGLSLNLEAVASAAQRRAAANDGNNTVATDTICGSSTWRASAPVPQAPDPLTGGTRRQRRWSDACTNSPVATGAELSDYCSGVAYRWSLPPADGLDACTPRQRRLRDEIKLPRDLLARSGALDNKVLHEALLLGMSLEDREAALNVLFRDFVLELTRGAFLALLAPHFLRVVMFCQLDEDLQTLVVDQKSGRRVEFPIQDIRQLSLARIVASAESAFSMSSTASANKTAPRQPPPSPRSDDSSASRHVILAEFPLRRLAFVFPSLVEAECFRVCFQILVFYAKSRTQKSTRPPSIALRPGQQRRDPAAQREGAEASAPGVSSWTGSIAQLQEWIETLFSRSCGTGCVPVPMASSGCAWLLPFRASCDDGNDRIEGQEDAVATPATPPSVLHSQPDSAGSDVDDAESRPNTTRFAPDDGAPDTLDSSCSAAAAPTEPPISPLHLRTEPTQQLEDTSACCSGGPPKVVKWPDGHGSAHSSDCSPSRSASRSCCCCNDHVDAEGARVNDNGTDDPDVSGPWRLSPRRGRRELIQGRGSAGPGAGDIGWVRSWNYLVRHHSTRHHPVLPVASASLPRSMESPHGRLTGSASRPFVFTEQSPLARQLLVRAPVPADSTALLLTPQPSTSDPHDEGALTGEKVVAPSQHRSSDSSSVVVVPEKSGRQDNGSSSANDVNVGFDMTSGQEPPLEAAVASLRFPQDTAFGLRPHAPSSSMCVSAS